MRESSAEVRPHVSLSVRRVVLLIGAVQFINILDFVMVMPLGPDFARALDIDLSRLGLIGGSYTLAAAVSGVVGSFFLERFDRRQALRVALFGLSVGTLCGGFAQGLTSLVAARLLAGAFGGPATSLSFSILTDTVSPERRGRAMGTVMGAFAVASVLGVPLGLWLAQHGGWRMPFFALAVLAWGGTLAVGWVLPPLRDHLASGLARADSLRTLLGRPTVRLSYGVVAVSMGAGFVLIPNLSAYVQGNLGFPRERLGELYLVGGVASFLSTRFGGALVDRLGSFRVGLVGATLLMGVIFSGFAAVPSLLPVPLIFVGFMAAMGLRNVAVTTLSSKVPGPHERARFMSLLSAVQHLSSSVAAMGSSVLLSASPEGALVGMSKVAVCALGLSAVLPVLMWRVERRLQPKLPPTLPAT